MATQNPIEQEGTYPLPEAQLDRFFSSWSWAIRARRAEHDYRADDKGVIVKPDKVMDGTEIVQWQQLVARGDHRTARAGLHCPADTGHAPGGAVRRADHEPYLRWAAARAARQTLSLAAKVRALLSSRYNVSFEDVRRAFLPAMRHRGPQLRGEAEGIAPDKVLLEILEKVPEKADDAKVA